MIFYLHYTLLTSGLSGTSVLLGVYLQTYSDASQGEIGALLMSFPFVCLFVKPFFCSLADRHQAHKNYLVTALSVMLAGYLPYIVIPFFPQFYTVHPRVSWMILFVAGHVGNCGLGVAWSLGDSLAVNMSHRKGTEYSRMRLMGTVSWGLYGYIIGLINEVPTLPKYIPSFLTMHASVLVEIVLILLWNDDDFKMSDKIQDATQVEANGNGNKKKKRYLNQSVPLTISNDPKVGVSTIEASVIQTVVSKDPTSVVVDEEANKGSLLLGNNNYLIENLNNQECVKPNDSLAIFTDQKTEISDDKSQPLVVNADHQKPKKQMNFQLVLFKMIFIEDGRLMKYLILFTMAGLILTPMNFLFLSLNDVCKQKGCNFSRLAGSILISQATVETLCFLIVPLVLPRVHRFYSLSFGLTIMIARYFFYSTFFYTSDISPYWAVIGEWGHGITYGIYCTIMADVALMFASFSRLFIPELRKSALLSEKRSDNKKRVEAEEENIKVALRATMQATFGGCMDGLGGGLGSLLCGLVADWYSYITMWEIFLGITIATLILYTLIEVTRCRWSDFYRAPIGSKAHEIKSIQGHRGKISNVGENFNETIA